MPNPARTGLIVFPWLVLALVWMAFRYGHGAAIVQATETARFWTLSTFSFVYLGAAALAIFAVLLALVLIGGIRIGGLAAPRRVTPFEAVAVGFGASASAALLFWAAGEPLYHVHQPPPLLNFPAYSDGAQVMARAVTYLHWAVLPAAVNGVFLIGFGIAATVGLRGGTENLLLGSRERVRGGGAALVDGIVVLFVTLALVTSLTSVAVSLASQVVDLTGRPMDPAAVTGILGFLVLFALYLGARPLGLSLAGVARVGLVLLLVFLLAVFILGPKGFTLGGGFKALWMTVRHFPTLMFDGLGAVPGEWSTRWTMTHLGGWIVLAPLIGFALSRAARGYSVSEALLYLVIAPMLLTVLCVMILSGLSLSLDREGGGALWSTISAQGTDAVLLRSLDTLPGAGAWRWLLVFLGVTGFATFAGAIVHAILFVAVPGPDADRRVIGERRAALLIYGLSLGIAGWALLRYGGADVVAAVGRLGAVPGVLLVIFAAFAVIRLCFLPTHRLNPPLPPPDSGGRAQEALPVEKVGTVHMDRRGR